MRSFYFLLLILTIILSLSGCAASINLFSVDNFPYHRVGEVWEEDEVLYSVSVSSGSPTWDTRASLMAEATDKMLNFIQERPTKEFYPTFKYKEGKVYCLVTYKR